MDLLSPIGGFGRRVLSEPRSDAPGWSRLLTRGVKSRSHRGAEITLAALPRTLRKPEHNPRVRISAPRTMDFEGFVHAVCVGARNPRDVLAMLFNHWDSASGHTGSQRRRVAAEPRRHSITPLRQEADCARSNLPPGTAKRGDLRRRGRQDAPDPGLRTLARTDPGAPTARRSVSWQSDHRTRGVNANTRNVHARRERSTRERVHAYRTNPARDERA